MTPEDKLHELVEKAQASAKSSLEAAGRAQKSAQDAALAAKQARDQRSILTTHNSILFGKVKLPPLQIEPEINEKLCQLTFPNQQDNQTESTSLTDSTEKSFAIFSSAMEAVTTRRDKLNNFFLTINLAVVTAVGVTIGKAMDENSPLGNLPATYLTVLTLTAGFFCVAWFQNLKSHWLVSISKIDLHKVLESKLPVRPFTAQYAAMKENHYKGFTELSGWVCILFGLAQFALAIAIAAHKGWISSALSSIKHLFLR